MIFNDIITLTFLFIGIFLFRKFFFIQLSRQQNKMRLMRKSGRSLWVEVVGIWVINFQIG